MKTPKEIIKAQTIRYVDSWQVGDGANTLAQAVVAALHEAGYRITQVDAEQANVCYDHQGPIFNDDGTIECYCRKRVGDGMQWAEHVVEQLELNMKGD